MAEVHDRDVTERLHDAGASMAFLRVFHWEGPKRNQIYELVAQYDDFSEIPVHGGDFANALWEGDLEEAWYRADGSNTYILTDIYDEWEIDLHMDRQKGPRAFTHEDYYHESWL